MDGLDLAILREMSREADFMWAGQDPRVTSDDVAERLRVAGSTVRARLRAWQEAGFLVELLVLPNPCLLGAGLARGFLRVDDIRAKQRVLSDLALIDGVVGALDHVGPWIGVGYVAENEAALARSVALVRRLAGVQEASPPELLSKVRCEGKLSPLDWRLVKALRAGPEKTFAQLAREVGISTRTFTRRYTKLAERHALWTMPVVDFTKFHGGAVARLLCTTSGGPGARKVAEELRKCFPEMLELHAHRASQAQAPMVDVLLFRPSVGEIEDAQRIALDLPGVKEAEVVFPRRLHAFPYWFDVRVEALAGGGEAQPVRATEGAMPTAPKTLQGLPPAEAVPLPSPRVRGRAA